MAVSAQQRNGKGTQGLAAFNTLQDQIGRAVRLEVTLHFVQMLHASALASQLIGLGWVLPQAPARLKGLELVPLCRQKET